MTRIILIKPEADRRLFIARFNDHPRPFDRTNSDDITGFELGHLMSPPNTNSNVRGVEDYHAVSQDCLANNGYSKRTEPEIREENDIGPIR